MTSAVTNTRQALHDAVDKLSMSDIATLRHLAARSTAPGATAWFLELARSVAQAAGTGSSLSPDVVVTMRCLDCLGPTSCDCIPSDDHGCL